MKKEYVSPYIVIKELVLNDIITASENTTPWLAIGRSSKQVRRNWMAEESPREDEW